VILKAFSIQDVKGEVFHTPFFFAAVGQAVRAFKDLANDANTIIGRHPGDYKLVEVGVFDDATGVLLDGENTSHGFASEYVDRLPVELREVKHGS